MNRVTTLLKSRKIRELCQTLQADLSDLIDLIIAVQQIPAPTFSEENRAHFVYDYFQAIELTDITMDEMYNVYGCYRGQTRESPVVITAHSDTVFPFGTDLTVRREGNLLYGAGIGDNSAGVAGVMKLASVLAASTIQPQRDIWFVVNVGEEGLGDLKGMRVVTRRFRQASAFIVVEGGMFGYVLHEAIGVQRFRVSVKTSGGHSWSDFGRTSAIHTIAHLIADIDSIELPPTPKTTYNVGMLYGGTSINTIASHASFDLDLRSESAESLQKLVDQCHKIVHKTRLSSQSEITITPIGNRPAGKIDRQTPLIRDAEIALQAVGCKKVRFLRGSTDANIPLSLELPAVCIGLTRSGHAHRADEFIDTPFLANGMQQLLLLALASAESPPSSPVIVSSFDQKK